MFIVTAVFADSGPDYQNVETEAEAVARVVDVVGSELLVSVTVAVANFAVTVTADDSDWEVTEYFGTLSEARAFAEAQPAGRFCTTDGLMR